MSIHFSGQPLCQRGGVDAESCFSVLQEIQDLVKRKQKPGKFRRTIGLFRAKNDAERLTKKFDKATVVFNVGTLYLVVNMT